MPDTDITRVIAAPSPSESAKTENEAGNGLSSSAPECKKDIFQPSVKACAARKCPDLVKVFAFGRYQRRCQLSDGIPGNMRVCPKDDELCPGVKTDD